ncbi:MAG: thiamine phosphate synthase [Treponemataceae bacterium]
MKCIKKDLLLYAVTDTRWLNGDALEDHVEMAIKGGVTCVQLREKHLSFENFVLQAKKVKTITDTYSIPLYINDNLEVALAVNADGVHVGQSDIIHAISDVRKRLNADKILGVSVTTVEQALIAQQEGADYVGVGAVFSTDTKEDACDVPLDQLKLIAQSIDIPVVAIGGIGKNNIHLLKNCNLAGVALVSAIFAQPAIEQATKELYLLAKQNLTEYFS